ncbi:hypothetical protein DFJ63DRAFT_315082 [Scheffersomyces coipomensis]|uniref:uncharacterized protein n=1 Tax=Scheffersomyces coipomensis TaxID=1788519 RepID=UPI00315D4CEB
MTAILYLLSCRRFIVFYKRNRDKDINLFDVLNDREISKVYFEGLSKLENILKDIDINENTPILNDIKKIIIPWEKQFIDNFKQILIFIYKACNSHFVYQDLNKEDVMVMKLGEDFYNSIMEKDLRYEFRDDILRQKALNFKRYTLHMKTLTIPWGIIIRVRKSKSSHMSTNSSIESDPRSSRRIDFNDTFQRYSGNNSFFRTYGFFYPQSDSEISSFIEANLDLLNITPGSAPYIFTSGIPKIYIKKTKEVHIEMELMSLLDLAGTLFASHNLKFDHQETKKFTSEELGIVDRAVPDIIISINNEVEIPLEVKKEKVKQMYDSFDFSRRKNNKGSSQFVELFSQAFNQSLLCYTNTFFISDGEFCLGFIVDDYPLPSYDISNLHGIPCKIIPFDSKSEKISMPIFIAMVVLKYSKKVEKQMIDNYFKSLKIADTQKLQMWIDRYKILNSFRELLSNVPQGVDIIISRRDLLTSPRSIQSDNTSDNDSNIDSDDDTDDDVVSYSDTEMVTISDLIQDYSVESPRDEISNEHEDMQVDTKFDSSSVDNLKAIHDAEERILSELGIRISLKNFYIIINTMQYESIDITSIQDYTIISGGSPQKNFSIVIKDGDDKIYKIFDPILCQVDATSNIVSFEDRLKYCFKCFIRESLMHLYLNEDFEYKPRCYSIGFMTNKNSVTHLDIKTINSMSGFFIKMEYCKGLVLEKLTWSSEIESQLKTVIDCLHLLGVSHGDIHSSNFLYDTDTKSMRILDFGRSYQAYLRGNAGNRKKGRHISRLKKRIQFDNENIDTMVYKLTHTSLSHFPSVNR